MYTRLRSKKCGSRSKENMVGWRNERVESRESRVSPQDHGSSYVLRYIYTCKYVHIHTARIRIASQTRPPTIKSIRTEATLLMNGSTRPLVAFNSQWLAIRAALFARFPVDFCNFSVRLTRIKRLPINVSIHWPSSIMSYDLYRNLDRRFSLLPWTNIFHISSKKHLSFLSDYRICWDAWWQRYALSRDHVFSFW